MKYTFSLYYITYRDLTDKDEGTTSKSDVGYSVNAISETYTTEDGETVQSVQTNLIHTATNTTFKWSDTMTLTWTKDGEEQHCKLHIVPYCDLEEPTHLTVSTMNGNKMEGCPLAQVDENTYRTRAVQGRTTNINLVLTKDRFKATINGTDYEKGKGFPVDTSEIGTKTYTLVVSDTGEQAETRSYDIIIDTISEEDDFTPRLDTTKTTNGGSNKLYTIKTADQAELKMVLDETQAQKVQAAGGTTTYSWQVNNVEVSTSDSYTIETKYKFSMVQIKCFITNTVDGAEWTKQFFINVKNSVPGAIDYVKAKADANERLHPAKVTDNARVILALTAIGKDVTNVGGHNLLKGLDNMDYVQTQGINGPIWALIALDSHNYPTSGDVTREKLIQAILDAQLPGGGWNLSGNDADPDMTAMAIQALAPYYKTNETVKAAVDKALEALSALQRSDGGFGSWGTVNSESCAQVIVALTALGIDPAKDSRFVKNDLTVLDALASFYVTGGGFKHVADKGRDGMATEQGYYALAAYYRFVNAQTRLYDMSDVTIQTGGSNTPATGDTGVLVWVIALPVTILAAAFVLKRKEREA